MRILTLVSGSPAVADAARLAGEVRSFNAGVDFRLRFLHIEIEALFAGAPADAEALAAEVDWAKPFAVPAADPLRASAALALLLARERPKLVVVVGDGALLAPGAAAAAEAGVRVAYFGDPRGGAEGAIDLGAEPAAALDRMTGVAREIR